MKRKEEAPAKGADTVKEWMEAHPGICPVCSQNENGRNRRRSEIG